MKNVVYRNGKKHKLENMGGKINSFINMKIENNPGPGRFINGYFLKNILLRSFSYLLLLSVSFVFMYPFLYMIITSLKSPYDMADIFVKWIPKQLFFFNYRYIFKFINFPQYLKNSVLVVTLCTMGHIFSCSLIGYGFARYKFKAKGILFSLVILTLIVPVQVTIIPTYFQFVKLKWINTFLPLAVPTFFGFGLKGGLFVFIFRQFFLGMPADLENAARIDGCGAFYTYLKIILPLANSAILVSFILSIVWHWNDYLEPAIYLTKSGNRMLTQVLPGLYEMLKNSNIQERMAELAASGMYGEAGTLIFNEAIVMASTFIVILPILILYIFLQKRFAQGIERTGLTE